MSISEIFIRRPIATTIIMLAIVFFGIMGYQQLPVSDLPNVDFPTINVNASLPGASPETMAAAVATPLERQFSSIDGIDTMTSTSTLGSTQVTIQFKLSRNIDGAAQDVQAAISKAARQLPPSMPTPPSFSRVNPADLPIIILPLSSPTLPLSTVDEFAQTFIGQRISMISGVAQVQVMGSQKYAVRIKLDPRALSSYGLGIDEVVSSVQRGNVNLPTGTIDGAHRSFTIEATGQLEHAKDYLPLIVAYRNGAPIRIRDIGTAEDSVENDKIASWFNSSRGIMLMIQRQPGVNTVAVVDEVKKLLPSFHDLLPASISLDILHDRSLAIRNSVRDVKFTLLLAVVLVILVIFIFLRNLSATLIPATALPVSLIGSFAVMYVLGYSMDNFSLMALILSVGFVVDDAIVMLENISRHIEMGEEPYEAALNGSKEIGFTILSMTLSLAAVFLPVLFMGGILGRLLNEFAVTIAMAIIFSGFVSLSLTPMLCSRFLKHEKKEGHGSFYNLLERFFNAMLSFYQKSLTFTLRHKPAVLALSIALLFVAAYLFIIVPKGFLPSEDLNQLYAYTEGSQGSSFDAMVRRQQAAAEIIRQNPNIDNFMCNVNSNTTGVFSMHLVPRPKRRVSPEQVIDQLRPKLAQIPGLRVYIQVPPPLRLGGRLSKSLYQFTLQGTSTKELYEYAPKLEAQIRELPGFMDVTSDLLLQNPKISVDIDRNKASALGITADQVESSLYNAYGAKWVSTIYTSINQYQVIVELADRFQLDPTALSMLYVRSSQGKLVPLHTIANISRSIGPLSVNHQGQLPAVTISFNLKAGFPLSKAVSDVQGLARQVLPISINTSFQGTAQAFQSSFKGLWLLLILSIVVIYIILGILYESFIHPVTILSGLPSAALGALVTLLLFHRELDLYGFVGVIMLVGIVKKNAIMMIDFALKAERDEGKEPEEAIYQGCIVRFRPIMMTSMSALMGTLPIALALGAGGEARQPLGLCVVGGLVFSQVLTLYITPVIYLYLDALMARRRKGKALPQPA
jgi:hydrophobic/amphiphilic exporter-1 (mainly G- bacteria), HAE1 family